MNHLTSYMAAVVISTAFIPGALWAQQSDETLILKDGTRVTGHLVGAGDHDITFRERDGDIRHFSDYQVQVIEFHSDDRRDQNRPDQDRRDQNYHDQNYREQRDSNAYPPPPPPVDYRNGNADQGNQRDAMMIPAGSEIAIRTDEDINSRSASESRSYAAQVARDVVDANGNVVVPRGSEARLVVRPTNGNEVALDLQSVNVNGRRYIVDTNEITRGNQGLGKNRRTGEYVGGGAGLGALIGAIAGGGKGAGIGAIVGGAAGAGAQVLTKGNEVRVPAETVLNFRLDSPVNLRYTH